MHIGHAGGPHRIQQPAHGVQLALAHLGVGEGLLGHPRRRQRRQGHAFGGVLSGQAGQVPGRRRTFAAGRVGDAQHDVAHRRVAAEGPVALVVPAEGGEDSDIEHVLKDSHGRGPPPRVGIKKPARRCDAPGYHLGAGESPAPRQVGDHLDLLKPSGQVVAPPAGIQLLTDHLLSYRLREPWTPAPDCRGAAARVGPRAHPWPCSVRPKGGIRGPVGILPGAGVLRRPSVRGVVSAPR